MSTFKHCKVCSNEVKLINEKYNLGQCQHCKLIFCLTVYTQEEFVAVYDKLYNSEDAAYINHSVVEYKMLLENKKIKIGYHRSKLIEKHVLNGHCKSVLEIGSGIGLLGMYLKNKDRNLKYLGIEIDQESFDKSQKLGLNTVNADFTEMGNLKETYDVIMLWEVIEHLQDLKSFIELAYQRLNKNGKIILSTPNYDKIYNYPNRQKDAIYQDLPPVHLNFFTKENMIAIFELHQFSNSKATVKKFPYIDVKRFGFYLEFLLALLYKYNGSTIYFVSEKLKD